MIRHILVPIDDSPLSIKAAKYAARLARSCGARVTALHVIPSFRIMGGIDGVIADPELYSPVEYRKSTERCARKLLAKALRRQPRARRRGRARSRCAMPLLARGKEFVSHHRAGAMANCECAKTGSRAGRSFFARSSALHHGRAGPGHCAGFVGSIAAASRSMKRPSRISQNFHSRSLLGSKSCRPPKMTK
jgi:nucleotide-binding universal stress UspA family protein